MPKFYTMKAIFSHLLCVLSAGHHTKGCGPQEGWPCVPCPDWYDLGREGGGKEPNVQIGKTNPDLALINPPS